MVTPDEMATDALITRKPRSLFSVISATYTVDGMLANPVEIPVSIRPTYICSSVGWMAINSQPKNSGKLMARRATRRPNLSRRCPLSRHPIGVAIDARLANKHNLCILIVKTRKINL